MEHQVTYDNNAGLHRVEDEKSLMDLKRIAGKTIEELVSGDSSNILIFPDVLDKYGDGIKKQKIFKIHECMLTTNNIMGFIGVNDTELKIRSGFDKNGKDYFMYYMLQKVFSLNIFDMKHSSENESILDFALFLFPYFLKKAVNQGLYKTYLRRSYNDSNVQGIIDISRHIKKNIPFNGRIAYSKREYSYDNQITELVRHTIEYLKTHPWGNSILHNDSDTESAVMQIIMSTPSYDMKLRQSVINDNVKPVRHPYYTEYTNLQKLCLQILKYEGLKYGYDKDRVYGVLFDGAWLWEEYVATILHKTGFVHPKNKEQKGGISLFSNGKYKRYPDFMKSGVILDAKYKRLENQDELSRNDMHQIISYMYIQKALKGGFIYPVEKENDMWDGVNKIGELNGYGGEIMLYGLKIPQETYSYKDFCFTIANREDELRARILIK